MPKLTRAEARMIVYARRLILLFREHLRPSVEVQEIVVLNLIRKELAHMSMTFDSEMEQLRADVAAQNSVIASATAAFRGLAAQIVAAEAAAMNAGATEVQIASVASLRQSLEANTTMLASAIPANTPVTTPAPTAPASSSAPVEAPAPATPEPTAEPAPSQV